MSSGDGEAADILLRNVAIERVRQTTQELQQRTTQLDDRDVAKARLLLDQYTTAVANLRAVTHLAAQRIADGSEGISDVRRWVRHHANPTSPHTTG